MLNLLKLKVYDQGSVRLIFIILPIKSKQIGSYIDLKFIKSGVLDAFPPHAPHVGPLFVAFYCAQVFTKSRHQFVFHLIPQFAQMMSNTKSDFPVTFRGIFGHTIGVRRVGFGTWPITIPCFIFNTENRFWSVNTDWSSKLCREIFFCPFSCLLAWRQFWCNTLTAGSNASCQMARFNSCHVNIGHLYS